MAGGQSNIALMERVARAFKEGDLRPLADIADENLVWRSTAPVEFFRFGGTHRMRAGLVELMAQIFATFIFRRLDAREIVASGEVVWGLFEIEAQHLASGRTVLTDYAVRWRVRDGKLIEHQGFFDTAGVLLQQGIITAPVPSTLGA